MPLEIVLVSVNLYITDEIDTGEFVFATLYQTKELEGSTYM